MGFMAGIECGVAQLPNAPATAMSLFCIPIHAESGGQNDHPWETFLIFASGVVSNPNPGRNRSQKCHYLRAAFWLLIRILGGACPT